LGQNTLAASDIDAQNILLFQVTLHLYYSPDQFDLSRLGDPFAAGRIMLRAGKTPGGAVPAPDQ